MAGCELLQAVSTPTGASAADSHPGEKVSTNTWGSQRKGLGSLWHGVLHLCSQFAIASHLPLATKLLRKKL